MDHHLRGLESLRAGCCRQGFSLVCRVMGGTISFYLSLGLGPGGTGVHHPSWPSSLPPPTSALAWFEFSQGLSGFRQA